MSVLGPMPVRQGPSPRSGLGWQNLMFAGRPAAEQAGPPPAPAQWAPAAQGNPRLPAGRNVTITTPRHRAENRSLDAAAQQAGLPAWNWQAEENKAMLQAAQGRRDAAMTQREAQGGRGYITADNLPAELDKSRAEYWQGADMQAWAAANPKLAQAAMTRAGYDPQAANLAALSAAAAPAPVSGPGAAAGSEWSPANSPTGMGAPLATAVSAGPAPGFDGVTGPEFSMPSPNPGLEFASEQRQRAAALSNGYLRAIKQHGMGLA